MLRSTPPLIYSTSADSLGQRAATSRLIPLLVFAAAFLGDLVANALIGSPRNALVFDSAHYYWSSGLMYEFLTKGALSPDLFSYLSLDGPVLPLLGAVSYILSGKPPALAFPEPLIALQCAIQSSSAVAFYFLAARIKNDPRWSLAWTAAFILLPASLIASGRFLTEPLSNCILLWLMLTFCKTWQGSAPGRLGFAAGALGGLLILTKPALVPAAALAALPCLIKLTATCHRRESSRLPCLTRYKQPLAGVKEFTEPESESAPARASRPRRPALVVWVAGTLLGLATAMAPWVVSSSMATKHLSLMPERLPGWNMALGSDIETDGFSAIPMPAILEQNYFDKPAAIAYGVYFAHPAEFVSLCLRKIGRLFALPWNDFKQSVLGLGYNGQLVIHQLILMLGLAGGVAALVRGANTSLAPSRDLASGAKEDSPSAEAGSNRAVPAPASVSGSGSLVQEGFPGLICAATAGLAFLGHLAFLPFEAIPRYAYSATPCLILLAMFYLASLESRRQRVAILMMSLLLVLAVAACNANMAPLLMQGTSFVAPPSYELSCLIEWSIRSALVVAFLSMVAGTSAVNDSGSAPRRMATVITVLAAAAGVAAVWAQAANPRPHSEWDSPLQPGDRAIRNVYVDLKGRAPASAPDWAAIVFDCSPDGHALALSINNQPVTSRIMSIYDVPHPFPFQQTLLHTIEAQARAQGVSRQAMRQWRLVKVPLHALRDGAWNQISIAPNGTAPVIVFGDYGDSTSNRLHVPALQPFAVCKAQTSASSDGRIPDIIGYPRALSACTLGLGAQAGYAPKGIAGDDHRSPSGFSWATDLSRACGLQTGDYRLFLLVAYKKVGKAVSCSVDGMSFENEFITLF